MDHPPRIRNDTTYEYANASIHHRRQNTIRVALLSTHKEDNAEKVSIGICSAPINKLLYMSFAVARSLLPFFFWFVADVWVIAAVCCCRDCCRCCCKIANNSHNHWQNIIIRRITRWKVYFFWNQDIIGCNNNFCFSARLCVGLRTIRCTPRHTRNRAVPN